MVHELAKLTIEPGKRRSHNCLRFDEVDATRVVATFAAASTLLACERILILPFVTMIHV
ncbi:MAG: hypothetical protein HXY34_11920 [Candidatus Thorarchaeota archaeon]|nr:hypothetical protein [Candidatus Thorarchaeota archaeon]